MEDPGTRPAAPSASNRILFVGRLAPEKGPGTLLEAWQALGETDLELAVAGDGPMHDELAARQVPGVTMLGRQDGSEIRRLMLESRALVFPSEWYEGMPITLLEAMAAGLPILASDLGSMTEMVGALGEKWLTTAGDAGAWAAAIGRLAGADVDAAGSAARTTWESRYSPTVALTGLLDAYRF